MRFAVVAVIAALILSACGGSDDGGGLKPLDTATPSASPTPDEVQNTTRPKDAKTEPGAIAFSEFAVRSIVATTGGASVEDFLALATDACKGCITLAKQFGQNPDEIQKFDAPPQISDGSVIKRDGSDYVVKQTVAMSAGKKVKTADDSVSSTFDAMTYVFTVRLTWSDADRWVISDYAVEEAG